MADTTAPVLDLDFLPANDTIQCGMDPDLLESTDFSVEDDCSEWTFSAIRETTGEDENPCNYFHTDTYTFTDCDGNETVFVHILTVIDTEGPPCRPPSIRAGTVLLCLRGSRIRDADHRVDGDR